MKTLHITMTVIFVTALIVNTGVVLAQYGPGFSPVEHYPPINDTALKLLVMNSTEFKERTIGYNYTLAGIDHNWTSKGSNYYDFGGARVTFFVFGFENGTTKGDVFNIDSQMKIKNVFEYDADNPPAGYYTDRCMGCPLETGVTKPKCCDPYVPIPITTPLKQFKSGIGAKNVKCILGFELILKTANNSPACVELETAQKFVDRGWANMIISNALNSGTIVTIPVNSSISTSGLTFSPPAVKVVIGVNNTVEWINMDGVMNDITSDTGFFKTSLIPHGHAWEYLFDKTGTYQYHSAIHPWLKGTIIVLSPTTNANQSEIHPPQSQDPFVPDKDGKVDLSKIHLPLTQSGRLDYNKIGYLASENQFKKVLEQQNVKYTADNFFFLEGLSLLSLPPFTDYCGYVMDDNKIEHWFSSSFHNDTITNYAMSKSNPSPCKPAFDSCSCSLQTKIAENNTKDLSYFTASEEENVGEAVSHYLDKTGVVNVSNQFTVGKYNLQADPSLIHYCGKFTWGKQLEYFDGYMKGSDVMFFELASEKQKLCAINTDAKMFSFEYVDNGTGK